MGDRAIILLSDVWNLRDHETISGYLIKIEEKIYFITKTKVKEQNIEIYKRDRADERLKLNKEVLENNVYFYEVSNQIENENVDNDYENYPPEYKKAINNFKDRNKKRFTICEVILIVIAIVFIVFFIVFIVLFIIILLVNITKDNNSNSNPYPNSQ